MEKWYFHLCVFMVRKCHTWFPHNPELLCFQHPASSAGPCSQCAERWPGCNAQLWYWCVCFVCPGLWFHLQWDYLTKIPSIPKCELSPGQPARTSRMRYSQLLLQAVKPLQWKPCTLHKYKERSRFGPCVDLPIAQDHISHLPLWNKLCLCSGRLRKAAGKETAADNERGA